MRLGIAAPIDVSVFAEFVSDDRGLTPGYTFPMTSLLALEYIKLGHHVSVFAEDSGIVSTQKFHGPSVDVTVVPLRDRAYPRALDKFRVERNHLRRAMGEAALDIIHAHWTYEFAWAALDSGAETLITAHDWAPAVLRYQPGVYRFRRLEMQRTVLRRARDVTAPSPYLSTRIQRWTSGTVTTIPNGLSAMWWLPGGRGANQPRGAVIGSLLNGFTKRKNAHQLLQAFRIAKRSYPNLVLNLAGVGYEAGGPAHQWASLRGLDQGVVFAGGIAANRVPAFLDGLALYVHPSLEESFGMAPVEAVARRIPVLASAGAGALSWVLNPTCLASWRDAEGFAAEIIHRLNAPPSKRTLCDLAEEAQDRFSLEHVATQYLGQIQRILKHR